LRAFCITTLCGLSLACAGDVSLVAKPTTVCAGRAVRLTWTADAGGTLTQSPGESLGDVPASGQKTVHPKESTTYTLRAGMLFGAKSADAAVTVIAVPGSPVSLGASTSDETAGCSRDKVWVTARVAADAWSPKLRVDLVSARGRSLRVEHLGGSVQVAGSETSATFRDLPIAGPWRIEAPLLPGESCGGTLPERLELDVSLVCAD
jgi:hypothetical protein